MGYRAAEGDRVVIKSVGDCVGHDDGWASLDDAWTSKTFRDVCPNAPRSRRAAIRPTHRRPQLQVSEALEVPCRVSARLFKGWGEHMLRTSIRLGLLAALVASLAVFSAAPSGAVDPTAAWCTDAVYYDFIQEPVGSSREADIFISNCGDLPGTSPASRCRDHSHRTTPWCRTRASAPRCSSPSRLRGKSSLLPICDGNS